MSQVPDQLKFAVLDEEDLEVVSTHLQDAVVKGIQGAQTGVQKIGAKLQSGSAKASAKKAQIQAEVNKYKSQIDGVVQQLKSALGI